MAAYDKNAEENQYPKMKYKGVDYIVVSNADQEKQATKDGYTEDEPDGRVKPVGRDVMPKVEPKPTLTADQAQDEELKGIKARLSALEAEVFGEPPEVEAEKDAKAKAEAKPADDKPAAKKK